MDLEVKQAEILDRCLIKVQRGEATLADCLRAYPEHAEALQVLLAMASEVSSQLGPDGPSQAFASNSRIRLMNRMRARRKAAQHASRVQQAAAPRSALPWGLRLGFAAVVSLLLVFVLTTTSVGVVYASNGALPGDALYGVKRGVEEARLILSPTAVGDAQLLAQFSDERLAELQALAELDRGEDLQQASANYQASVGRLISSVESLEDAGAAGALDDLETRLQNHLQVLDGVQARVPEPAKEAIRSAIERSSHGKDVIDHLKQGGAPSELAPGQEKKQDEAEPSEAGSEQADDKDARTAEQIARQYEVTEGEVTAVFDGVCEGDWTCVRDHFKDLKSGGQGQGNKGKGKGQGQGGGPPEGKGPNKPD